MTYRERRERRAERLREWADKRAAKSAAGFQAAKRIADGIPFGQPILVGHHSEKHHRADIARIDSGMRRGIENENKAAEMRSKAANIDAAADAAIYSDDPDAIEALTAKLERLEAERERCKVINKAIRKHGLALLMEEAKNGEPIHLLPALTAREAADLLSVVRHQPYYNAESKGFPPYHTANLGGNITRARQRLAGLKRDQENRDQWPEDTGTRERVALVWFLVEHGESVDAIPAWQFDTHRDEWSRDDGARVFRVGPRGEASACFEALEARGYPRRAVYFTIGGRS